MMEENRTRIFEWMPRIRVFVKNSWMVVPGENRPRIGTTNTRMDSAHSRIREKFVDGMVWRKPSTNGEHKYANGLCAFAYS
jgi:hypothetical protein